MSHGSLCRWRCPHHHSALFSAVSRSLRRASVGGICELAKRRLQQQRLSKQPGTCRRSFRPLGDVPALPACRAEVRGPLASTGFMLFVGRPKVSALVRFAKPDLIAGRRFLVGLVVVLALRAASKEILKCGPRLTLHCLRKPRMLTRLLVPRVFQILGIPCSDHEWHWHYFALSL